MLSPFPGLKPKGKSNFLPISLISPPFWHLNLLYVYLLPVGATTTRTNMLQAEREIYEDVSTGTRYRTSVANTPTRGRSYGRNSRVALQEL